VFIVGVTTGTGRKIEESLSLVIPGGGTSLEDEYVEEVDGGARGGTVEGADVVDI
jgi:hypothetical protein